MVVEALLILLGILCLIDDLVESIEGIKRLGTSGRSD